MYNHISNKRKNNVYPHHSAFVETKKFMTNYSFIRVILNKISFNTLHNVKHYTTQTIVTRHALTTRSLTPEREKNNEKIVGDTRHFPPANKE